MPSTISYLLPFLLAALPAQALPAIYQRAAQQTCDQFNPITSGPFQVENDIWGASPGTQCAQVDSQSGDSIAWSTTATFGADQGSGIKSYPNAANPSGTPCKPLNQYSSMKTSWQWSYPTPPETADVAYDAFLNPTSNGPGDPHTYEVMVWLAHYGSLQPIGSADTAVDAQVAGTTWKLWSGKNDQTGTQVFSFVAPTTVGDYSGDLMDFFNYLVQNNGVDKGLLVTSVQAGTEIAVGTNANFVTSAFSIGGA